VGLEENGCRGKQLPRALLRASAACSTALGQGCARRRRILMAASPFVLFLIKARDIGVLIYILFLFILLLS
jgi:hypothetical protein